MSTMSNEFTRGDVSFVSDEVVLRAWLYLPSSDGRKPPVIVMATGLGGTKSVGLDWFAERFATAGYACLVFDYRNFGSSGGEPREMLKISEQVADWRAAVDFAREIEDVDGERVILWGTSFGGGHAITTAAADHRIAAVIAQCPFTDGIASSRVVPVRTSLRLAGPGMRDVLARVRGKAPVRVPLVVGPGETGLMSSADALEGFGRMLEASGERDMPMDIPARVIYDIMGYAPGRKTKNVSCPILFCVCEKDTVVPAKTTLRQAKRAPKATVKTYDYGHFEIYLGEPFEVVIADQIEFLQSAVPVG